MARRKKKEKPANTSHFSVKCGLGNIILQPFRQPIIAIISQLSIMATNIAVLAGLLFLYKVNFISWDENNSFDSFTIKFFVSLLGEYGF